MGPVGERVFGRRHFIDVGDLDRVVQIDAPPSVTAFLQRMGRSGRRVGASRNCLFLATGDDDLLTALGITALWRSGFVDPVVPPPRPAHIYSQQDGARLAGGRAGVRRCRQVGGRRAGRGSRDGPHGSLDISLNYRDLWPRRIGEPDRGALNKINRRKQSKARGGARPGAGRPAGKSPNTSPVHACARPRARGHRKSKTVAGR